MSDAQKHVLLGGRVTHSHGGMGGPKASPLSHVRDPFLNPKSAANTDGKGGSLKNRRQGREERGRKER